MAKHMDTIALIENRIRHLFVRVAVGECDEDACLLYTSDAADE